MILGSPKSVNKFICVDSKIAEELHKNGFQPIYREIDFDRIYFIKTDDIQNMVRKLREQRG